MAAGVSGYIDFQGSSGAILRVNYSEIYDIATNTSNAVKVDSIQISVPNYSGYAHYMDGTVSINGTTVLTMSSYTASHPVYISAVNTFCTVANTSGSVTGIVHNSDGSKSVSIVVSVMAVREDGGGHTITGSGTITLTTIPRASQITSAGAVTLGNKCSVVWTPKAASFRYKLKFSMGDWSYTTGAIHPNQTAAYTYTGYTIPLDAAAQIPSAKTGTMTVELFSYSDSGAATQIGSSDSATFTVTVPDNNSTKPTVSMTLAPVSSLADAFAGLYIQGKTKVKATLSATGKYGAAIKSCGMKAENATYDAGDSYTSEFLASSGETTVYGYAKDSRGFTGSTSGKITVIAYTKPKIMAASGESEVVAARCDSSGNLSDSGTYLKIKAKRSYSTVSSGGTQKNFCKIQYRYKLEAAAQFSEWTTILEADDLSSDEIVTGALLGGVLSAQSTYVVEVRAVDDIGEAGSTTIYILTDTVYMHRTKNAMGLGKYAEGENLLDVAWDTHLRGEVKIGAAGQTLKEYILAVISEGG